MPSCLRDMELLPATAMPAQTRVADVAAGPGEWIVVVADSGPLAALPAAALTAAKADRTLADLVRSCPATPIASADTSVVAAVRSWAFGQLTDDGAVIVADADTYRVWAGEDLADILTLALVRSGIDTSLPGDVHIPVIRRLCGYGAGSCPAVIEFAEYPGTMPDCPDPAGLGPHQFVW